MQTATININTSTDLWEQASALFTELGLDISSAINLFLRQAVREKAIPFAVGLSKRRVTRNARTPKKPRAEAFGCMKGKIWMVEDFNESFE